MPEAPKPFNPLDMEHLAESVGNALLLSTPTRADLMDRFEGAGVYAIYYSGDFGPYASLREANRGLEQGAVGVPIYVGKADPPGGRKGLHVATGSRALSSRLTEHRRSIVQAENLDISDFYFRWLVVEPIWVPLGESILIQKFSPLWNAVLDGFGNHAPGSGRVRGVLSLWDTLHPGRSSVPRGASDAVYWADIYPPNLKSQTEIVTMVDEHLRSTLSQPVVGNLVGLESLPSLPISDESEDALRSSSGVFMFPDDDDVPPSGS